MPGKRKTKLDRCVQAVTRRGGAVNPYAVCVAGEERRFAVQVTEPKSRLRRAQRVGWLDETQGRVVTNAAEARLFHRKGDADKARKRVAAKLPTGWRARVFEVLKQNPRARGAELKRARKLYEEFSGHHARTVGSVNLPRDKVAIVVGPMDFVGYTTVRDGKTEKYMHKFKRASRPMLAVSADGKRLFLLGGSFTFTDRGIEDE